METENGNHTVNKVEVVINGEILTFKSPESEEYMQKLALYIDKKLDEIKCSKPNAQFNETIRMMLVAANIADDFYKLQEKYTQLENEYIAYLAETEEMHKRTRVLEDENRVLRSDLAYARSELDEYISTFDAENVLKLSPRSSGAGNR